MGHDPDTPHNRAGFQHGGSVGPYRLCFEIARGGMGRVFLARAPDADGRVRRVALKSLHPELRHVRELIAWFESEARIGQLIHHPNVCSVFDYGMFDGLPYLVMEFLHGRDLSLIGAELNRRGDVVEPEQRAALMAKLVADAGEGLHAIHELRGPDGELLHLLHRDVSPSNLIVTFDGSVKVIDLGVLGHSVHGTNEPLSDELVGKYAYLSPEAIVGNPLDRRADIWGLAVVAWELLTGRRLFARRSDPQTAQAVIDDDVPPPSSLVPGLPAAVDEAILRGLSREMERRHPTSLEFTEALMRAVPRAGEVTNTAVAEFMDRLFPNAEIEVCTARSFGYENGPTQPLSSVELTCDASCCDALEVSSPFSATAVTQTAAPLH